ncbi:hypothetical protein Pcinc_007576 [Petrolisthes cinctipes]|uniref:Uncharacterized protein n=1 Tax=Petrolisthes cinctipes TaxID=88211 RepID=A0AAE1L0C3_PETCI|nr:hypothetical protein Pcinc_007576 [Petrolisthes cinctipes]
MHYREEECQNEMNAWPWQSAYHHHHLPPPPDTLEQNRTDFSVTAEVGVSTRRSYAGINLSRQQGRRIHWLFLKNICLPPLPCLTLPHIITSGT